MLLIIISSFIIIIYTKIKCIVILIMINWQVLRCIQNSYFILNDLCSRFDIQQAPINANWYAYINCSQSPWHTTWPSKFLSAMQITPPSSAGALSSPENISSSQHFPLSTRSALILVTSVGKNWASLVVGSRSIRKTTQFLLMQTPVILVILTRAISSAQLHPKMKLWAKNCSQLLPTKPRVTLRVRGSTTPDMNTRAL